MPSTDDGDTQRLPDSPFPLFSFLSLYLSLCFCEWPISLFHLHRFPFSPLSLSTQLLPDTGRPARWLISPSVPFADKPSGASCEALPSSPNTSVTAQPKQATAMKSVLAGFGAGVSKPPNRSSPAPAAQNAQTANQAPNPASAFSGLVNNISNSAKKEQGSWTNLLLEDFLSDSPTSLKLILRVDLLGQTCSNPPTIWRRDQIFDWTHYLNTVAAVER